MNREPSNGSPKRPGQWAIGAAMSLGLVATLAACGGSANGKVTHIQMAAQDFAEPRIDDWIVKDLIQAKTPVTVSISYTTGASGLLHTLLLKNSIQAYVGYDGTEFTGPLHQAYTGKWKGHPNAVSAYVVSQEQKKWGLWVSPSLGYQDTYALAVQSSVAKKYHLTTDAQVAQYAPHWTIGTDPTFQQRAGDGYKAFTAAYGLHFKAAKAMDYSLMYEALAHGSIQAAVAYSTDARLTKLHETALKDTKHFFPPYHGIVIIQSKIVKEWHLNKVLKPLMGLITTKDQARMNYDVEVLKQSPQTVAKNFLVKHGLLKS